MENLKEKFILQSPGIGVTLRTATEADCEDLRRWKNANRQFFFHTEMISAEQQRVWFQGYSDRIDDWMFIVQDDRHAIGCMGFRVLEAQQVDIYNVILGDKSQSGSGSMSQAIQLMCSYLVAQSPSEIIARVLNSNPAQAWYMKNNFRKGRVYDSYTEFIFDRVQFHADRCTKTPLI